MKKESKTNLQSFCEHMSAHFNRLVKNPNQSLGISCESKKTETFIELVLEQNGYEVFSFDCNIYYKNKKPQLMTFFQTIKEQQKDFKKPAILLKNGSSLSLNQEDNELFYHALKNGFNLSDTSLFFPENSTPPKESKNPTKLIRGCEHVLPENIEGVNFCPECGKPALVEEVNLNAHVYVNDDNITLTDTTQTENFSQFIPIFTVSRDYLPANAHYTDILYPNGLSIESNPQIKKIWAEQEAAKNTGKTLQQKIDALKERDNELNIEIEQAQNKVKKATRRLDAMTEELLQKFSHIKPFSIPDLSNNQLLAVTSHEVSHSHIIHDYLKSDKFYENTQHIKNILSEAEHSEGYKKFSKFLKIGDSSNLNQNKIKKTDMVINKKLLQSFPEPGGFVDSSPYDKVWGIEEIKEKGSFTSVFKATEGMIVKDPKNKTYKY